MEKIEINGGNRWVGTIKVSGAKNSAMKAMLAGLLTNKDLILKDIPIISSVMSTAEILRYLGVAIIHEGSNVFRINGRNLKKVNIPLELGSLSRAATMVMGPLLIRTGEAVVPNPGGCRIGKRTVERHIEGLKMMGADIRYADGFFKASASGLHGVRYRFSSNTHTGTESMILAAVLAKGETILENAAEEPEVDDLIILLNKMGAKISRTAARTVCIQGVEKLGGTEHTVIPDRNEAVTFAIGALATGGDVEINGAVSSHLTSFLEKVKESGGSFRITGKNRIRFSKKGRLLATEVTTSPHPGFMTDWQAPWAVLMTQAKGESVIHETVYEDRFCYLGQLQKMGADFSFFNPPVRNPSKLYNFNWSDRRPGSYHAVKIRGPEKLHNAVLEVSDLRAGATMILAGAIASGKSIVMGVEHIDRGYENIEKRLKVLNVDIKRIRDDT